MSREQLGRQESLNRQRKGSGGRLRIEGCWGVWTIIWTGVIAAAASRGDCADSRPWPAEEPSENQSRVPGSGSSGRRIDDARATCGQKPVSLSSHQGQI